MKTIYKFKSIIKLLMVKSDQIKIHLTNMNFSFIKYLPIESFPLYLPSLFYINRF